jgi:hypothetical protein
MNDRINSFLEKNIEKIYWLLLGFEIGCVCMSIFWALMNS